MSTTGRRCWTPLHVILLLLVHVHVQYAAGQAAACAYRQVRNRARDRFQAAEVKYSLVQWNWFSDITGCMTFRCIQWRQRTNFTAPSCTGMRVFPLCKLWISDSPGSASQRPSQPEVVSYTGYKCWVPFSLIQPTTCHILPCVYFID